MKEKKIDTLIPNESRRLSRCSHSGFALLSFSVDLDSKSRKRRKKEKKHLLSVTQEPSVQFLKKNEKIRFKNILILSPHIPSPTVSHPLPGLDPCTCMCTHIHTPTLPHIHTRAHTLTSKSCWEHSQGRKGDKTGLGLTTLKLFFFFPSQDGLLSQHVIVTCEHMLL